MSAPGRNRGSAAAGLRRLRWWLTGLFTAMNALGLIVLSWLVISQDGRARDQALQDEAHRVTSTVQRLIQLDGATLTTAFVGDDEIDDQCPQFAVLPGAGGDFPAHYSSRACVPFEAAGLPAYATEAVRTGRVQQGYVTLGDDGRRGMIRVEPFRDDNGQYFGAVAAVADARASDAEHDEFALVVIAGCALLVLALGGVGHLISGRATHPAAAALEQQEILLAETAHDLRTPVAALRALAETAMSNPGQRDELLPRTVHLAARMGGIIDDLLVRARLAAGVEQLAIQPVWLDQLVTTVVEETPTDGAQVSVSAAPTKVNADPVLMQRAIGNLLTNAMRHGKRPGHPAVVHITVAGGRVVVADQGPGIDPALARESFDRFTSGGRSSGLGLSIVRWVAQAHGGALRVYNADEGGAIFELALTPSDPISAN